MSECKNHILTPANFRLLAMLAMVAMAALPTSADTLIKMVQHTPEMKMGAMVIPEMTDTFSIWLGDSIAKMDGTNGICTIYNSRTDSSFQLFPKFELYSTGGQSPLGGGSVKKGETANLTEGLSELAPLMMTAVSPTEDIKEINGYRCQRWVQVDSMPMIGAKMAIDIWATEDTQIDVGLYSKLTSSLYKGLSNTASMAERKKVRGLPILTTTSMDSDSTGMLSILGGAKSEVKVISITEVKITPDFYSIPPTYEKYPAEE